ncbi:MAG: DNA/RNA non-specific endonuclease [Ekhidna sp.]
MKALSTGLFFCISTILFSQPGNGYKPIKLDPNYNHSKWETSPSDLVYEFGAFTSSFDSNDDNDGDGKGESWGIPEWVSYEIKSVPNQTESGNRPSRWLTDKQGNKDGFVPNDATYAVSGVRSMKEVKDDYRYVRGHLCMKKIAGRVSLDAEYNTHTTLNAVPQLQWQNRGIWLALEYKTVEWAEKHGSVWVVCGPVFFGKKPAVWLGQEGEVKAAVPDALYKIVIKEVNGVPEALAFLIPNVIPSDKDEYSEFVTSVDRIEKLTGLDFMSNADIDEMETQNESLSANKKKTLIRSW